MANAIELMTQDDVLQSVEDGGAKPVSADAVKQALSNHPAGGKIELVFDGVKIIYEGQPVNFEDIVRYITEDSRFTYVTYNNRVLLTSDMHIEGDATRYVFFETSTTDGGISKNAVLKVYSANGVDISSLVYSTTANENINNKVNEITDRNKYSQDSYPSNKALAMIIDTITNRIEILEGKVAAIENKDN